MVVIHKYPLSIVNESILLMPRGASILSVQMQRGEPMLWAMVDPSNKDHPRKFVFYATGNAFNSIGLAYVATVQQGECVWHLFESFNP